MDNRISRKNYTLIASMLFGLFFGAGNLIFPIIMGAKAGANVVPALIGMLVTAVGIPLLGIIAMGISRSEGLLDMANRVSRPYSRFFTCALYLTIGPLFAIPRCDATSFTVGVTPLVTGSATLAQAASIWSTGWVRVVGVHEVVPRRASSSDAASTPATSQSMTSWPT